jgi:hypothetical protein
MDDPKPVKPAPSGGEQRRLDVAPGTRYVAATPVTTAASDGVSARGIGIAALVAAVGAAVFFVLGQLDLGAGLLAVAAFTGWITSVALVDLDGGAGLRPGPGRIALAACMAGGAILGAILLDWAWAGVQGGALGPLAYIGERYGPAALLDVAVAGLLAGLHAR